MKPVRSIERFLLLTLVTVFTACSEKVPGSNLVSSSEEDAGLAIWSFGEVQKLNGFTAATPVVRKTEKNRQQYIRFSDFIDTVKYDFDIPLANAEALVDFIEWAKDYEQDSNSSIKNQILLFHPLPGTDYWLRRSTSDDRWRDSFRDPLNVDEYLSALQKAITTVEKM